MSLKKWDMQKSKNGSFVGKMNSHSLMFTAGFFLLSNDSESTGFCKCGFANRRRVLSSARFVSSVVTVLVICQCFLETLIQICNLLQTEHFTVVWLSSVSCWLIITLQEWWKMNYERLSQWWLFQVFCETTASTWKWLQKIKGRVLL